MQYDKNYDIWDAYSESLPVEAPEPDCECRFDGDQADASGCDLHGARRPMGRADSIVWVSTPCSCVDGDTRTCFLHGEVA